MIEVFKVLLAKHRAKLTELNLSLQLCEIRDGSSMPNNLNEIIQNIAQTELYINKLQDILDSFEAKQNKEGKENVE
jgi:hypothetical protein